MFGFTRLKKGDFNSNELGVIFFLQIKKKQYIKYKRKKWKIPLL